MELVAKAWIFCTIITLVGFYMSLSPDLSGIKGQRVVVCGASAGIGKSIAMRYAALGAHLMIVSRSKDVLEKVAEECRSAGAASVHVFAADLSSEEAAKELVDHARKTLKTIDVLILNHIRPYFGSFISSKNLDAVREVINVNLMSYIYIAYHALPMLRESNGRLAIMSSFAGKAGIPFVAPYSAAKHALHGFADSIRLELELEYPKQPVSITTCILGNIDTESAKELMKEKVGDIQRASADDCADAVIAATELRQRELYFPWQATAVPLILRQYFPGVLDMLISKFMTARAQGTD